MIIIRFCIFWEESEWLHMVIMVPYWTESFCLAIVHIEWLLSMSELLYCIDAGVKIKGFVLATRMWGTGPASIQSHPSDYVDE